MFFSNILSTIVLTNPPGQTHPLVINQTLTLVACMVSGDIYLRKEFLSRQPILFPIQGDRVHYQVTSVPERSGLAGMIEGRLTISMYFSYHTGLFIITLWYNTMEGIEYNTMGVHSQQYHPIMKKLMTWLWVNIL